MRRYALVAVLASGSVADYADEAPEERPAQTERPADEQSSDRKGVPKDEPAKGSRVSLEDATAIVRQAYGGRVVSAASATARPQRGPPEPSAGEREGPAPRKEPSAGEREGPAPRKKDGHRVRVDIDGRVKTVFVDDRGRIHENAEY